MDLLRGTRGGGVLFLWWTVEALPCLEVLAVDNECDFFKTSFPFGEDCLLEGLLLVERSLLRFFFSFFRFLILSVGSAGANMMF